MLRQRRSARWRPASRALAGLALAALLAFVVTYSAAASPPANDRFANAITIVPDSGPSVGTTAEATTEAGEPLALNGGVTTSQTVWWKWVATSTGTFTFAAPSSVASPTIAVYTGASVDALTLVTNDVDGDPATGFES